MGKWWEKIRKRFNDWNQERQDRKDIEVWDDLFANPRPTHWPFHDCVMVVPPDTRATEDEIKRAWDALDERGIGGIRRGRK